jgi:DNA-binding GntR family transcriptional regulator
MNADRAYELIRERIISLELDPGVPIDETALARQIGMPPGSASDAVGRLIDEGWLERVNRGVQVTENTLVDIFSQLFEVRSVLEGLCARLTAERATEEQLERLQEMMPQFEEAARQADATAWIQLDQRFHELIYGACGNLFLENSLRQIYTLDLRIWYLVLDRMTDLPRVVESHRAIVEALKNRDPRAAERALTGHIRDSQAIVMPRAMAKQ